MDISLTGRLGSFVERQVETGRYRDADEVVRVALEGLEAADRLARSGFGSSSPVGLAGSADIDT